MAMIVTLIAAGVFLVWAGRTLRHRHGLVDAPTLDVDRQTLRSYRLGLAARPDSVIREGGMRIPVEQKSARKVFPNHLAQLGVQLILIEEVHGKRPTHGYIVTGDGERHRIENTDELREWVLKGRRNSGRRKGSCGHKRRADGYLRCRASPLNTSRPCQSRWPGPGRQSGC